MNNNDIIIIGGGLGGLTTGALLAKEGWQVTVLEKNHIVGGGLQNFSRHGIHFDTGMHILGGFTMPPTAPPIVWPKGRRVLWRALPSIFRISAHSCNAM